MAGLQMLKSGDTLRTRSTGLDCTVEELLGGGGQGEFYRARLKDSLVALKWYHTQTGTAAQLSVLDNLVRKGPPDKRFLWPADVVTMPSRPGFGYIMPLRSQAFRPVTDLMKRRIDPSFRALATAGFQLADSFLQLHSKGLCYRDISFGNLFLLPETGDILICDNDNVSVDGSGPGGVLGTPRFMAPEVVRGEALPSTQTDLFSLGVLLFYLFVVHHPLEGTKELAIHSFDLPAMVRLYGKEPVFIFDPNDRSNAPVPGYHDNALSIWPIYPGFLRDLFIKAFTSGISDPSHGRVREGEWRAAMVRLRDAILYCGHCGAENFWDPESSSSGNVCWSCQRRCSPPCRIRVGKNVVVLNQDTSLFPHHVDDQRPYDFSRPVAAINRHPDKPDLWGLKNLSPVDWHYVNPQSPMPVVVEPGKSAPLFSGGKIHFGTSEALVA